MFKIDYRTNFSRPGVKILWLTDLHLDNLDANQVQNFYQTIQGVLPDVLLVGGDIWDGSRSLAALTALHNFLKVPIYFVLGNHDFFYGSIQMLRKLAEKEHKNTSALHYLTYSGCISLNTNVVLIGHDGWADGQAGNFFQSKVFLQDYDLIDELKNCSQVELFSRLTDLGAEAAEYLSRSLEKAFQHGKKIILLTHVPPFVEACLYNHQIGNDNWTPHFVALQVGRSLQKIMTAHPDKELLILSGHTHCGADVIIQNNIRVVVGERPANKPVISGCILID
jgi:predicted MPP superfamily phosphohydrolase